MKFGRLLAALILTVCAIYISAQSEKSVYPAADHATTLWVVDGIPLTDSVIGYTPEQMRSDSAAVLASRALHYLNSHNICRITVIDSIEASAKGYHNVKEVVEIETSYRESILVIVDGAPYISKAKFSGGEVLGGYDYLLPIINDELPDLEEYGIQRMDILKNISIGCHPQRAPWLCIQTELPYYRLLNFQGDYIAKSGKQLYNLRLNADSTYVFKKKYCP